MAKQIKDKNKNLKSLPAGRQGQIAKLKTTSQNSKIGKSGFEAKSLKIVNKKTVKETLKVKAGVSDKARALAVVKKVSKLSLTLPIFDIKGKETGEVELPAEIFGVKINKQLISQAVRVYLANQRRGTASTKTRGEVTGSTRKIYKQKGTGRARHGSNRAPIFVHGGVALGPKPRDHSLNFPQKMKKAALFSALSSKLKSGEIKVIEGLEKIDPKTKIMAGIVKNLQLDKNKILLVISGKGDETNLVRASKNIENLLMIRANQLNTFEVLKSQRLVFLKNSIDFIKENYIKGK